MRWLTLLAVVALLACGEKDVGERAAPAGKPKPTANAPSGKSASDAGGKASKPEPVRKAPSPAYRAALRKGRGLVKAGKFEDAAAAFRDALKEAPDEPRALSELSLALFRAGELDEAEAAARKSALGSAGKLKAASLYNLGRVMEAKKDYDAAIEHYGASLQLRPNAIVAGRLAGLSKESASALAPRPWTASEGIDDTCGNSKDLPDWKCEPTAIETTIKNKTAPFENVADWATGGDLDPSGVIAIRAHGKWFISHSFYSVHYDTDHGSGSIDAASVVQVGAVAVLRIDVSSSIMQRFANYESEDVLFCGVGPSRVPSCTPFITKSIETTDYDIDNGTKSTSTATYKVTLAADGTLKVSTAHGSGDELDGMLGELKLVFP